MAPSAQAAVTTNAGDNNGYEGSPSNVFADDSQFASDLNSGTNKDQTCGSTGKDKHVFSNFNLPSLPAGSTILGIQVRLDARADNPGNSPKICVEISFDNGTNWVAAKQTPNLNSTEATYSLGGSADTWGRSWAVGDFTNANFRIRVTDVAGNPARNFFLDYLAVNVTYQP
jgi:hypothetical protein